MKRIFPALAILWVSAAGLAADTNKIPAKAVETNSPAQPAHSILLSSIESNMVVAPDLGGVTNANVLQSTNENLVAAALEHFYQEKMDLAIRERHEKNPSLAAQTLASILASNAPPEFKRKALFELALAEQDNNNFVRSQQIFAQFIQRYPEDPSAPEILLRQGLLYRQMGVNTLAISKFYAVMSTALKLKLDNIEYYRNLVLQAQTEIADTYYIQGQFDQATDFYTRLLKENSPTLNKQQIEFKLIRALSYQTNRIDTVKHAEKFLERFPNDADVPEVRFILASTYKALGRNSDALQQVLQLLQSQQENAARNPDLWVYWQRRAGNEIANQLYAEADYMDALQIYQNLAALDSTPAWQAPALYQVGLVYEQLQQWEKATDTYTQILNRKVEMTASNAPPSLKTLCEMAQWRKDYIAWLQKAQASDAKLLHSRLYVPPPPSTTNTASR